jgi:hypothetical protein
VPPFDVSVKPGHLIPTPFLFARVWEPVVYGDTVRRFRDGHHYDEARETSRFVAVCLRGTPSLGR